MDSMLNLILLSLAAFTLPGIVAWYIGRRHGLRVFWASLVVGALVMVYGWITARPGIAPELASRYTLTIYFVLLPAFMSLVLGAILGAWQHRMRVAI
ncbi:MAG TPA: hypothetical protein PLI13_02270 [Paracoccus sp. (in: a-proteobacteria)]|nr:hypothetical protein [Paracoccus sp. (in: a-proteobacteria)]